MYNKLKKFKEPAVLKAEIPTVLEHTTREQQVKWDVNKACNTHRHDP